jgi:hypothetical protein
MQQPSNSKVQTNINNDTINSPQKTPTPLKFTPSVQMHLDITEEEAKEELLYMHRHRHWYW